MFTTLLVVLPIFALIGIGYLCRRFAVLGPHATRELNRFVVALALPALLFDIMAHTHWAAIAEPGFVAAYGLSSLVVFGAIVAIRRGRPLADAGIDGLNAAYCNTGYIGFPLCLLVFGKDSLAPATIAAILTVCLVFAVAIVLIEIGLQSEKGSQDRAWGTLALKVGRSLATNPLLVSPLLGALFPATGLPLPDTIATITRLLGAAASPCALVALGLFLAEARPARPGDTSASLLFVGFKLLLHPALAWGLATFVFGLAPRLVPILVVLTALPTGTGPFMLAEFYGREAGVTSKTILVSTIGSLLTLTAYLAWVL